MADIISVGYTWNDQHCPGIIHLERSKNFPKNQHFLPPDTHTYMPVSEGKKHKIFGKFCERTKRMMPQMERSYKNN